jgi:phage anti-repressor protein/predicted GIY-YIG superfamily endonuclease
MKFDSKNHPLVTFLKRMSPIPNTFIDDMFELYNPDTAQTDLAVDIDAVAKWLGVRKENLMQTLRTSYTAGVDFTITKKPTAHPTSKYGSHAYKQVLVTPDCFKRICMRSRGKTAEDVRTYFIQIEALVMKYREQMGEGMQQEIDRLESGRRARKLPSASTPREGYIYVLKASQKYDKVVKLGRTRDLVRRLREHSAALADDPQVLFTFRTDDVAAVETCIKGWLKDRQWSRERYKEVYRADLDMVKQIVHGCDLVGHVKRVAVARTRGRQATATDSVKSGGAARDGLFFVVV